MAAPWMWDSEARAQNQLSKPHDKDTKEQKRATNKKPGQTHSRPQWG